MTAESGIIALRKELGWYSVLAAAAIAFAIFATGYVIDQRATGKVDNRIAEVVTQVNKVSGTEGAQEIRSLIEGLKNDLVELDTKIQSLQKKQEIVDDITGPNSDKLISVYQLANQVKNFEKFKEQIDLRTQETSKRIDSIFFWIIGILVSIVAGIASSAVYLLRKAAILFEAARAD